MNASTILVSVGFLISFCTGAFAQHERLLTQFMYNKLAINPGYAGTYDGIAATAFYRNQWIGFDGAPTTIGLNIDAALKKEKVGLGLNIVRHTISIFDQWTLDGIYAYKIKLSPKSFLSAGLQGSLRYIGANFQDPRLRSSQGLDIDPALPTDAVGFYILNFGFGLYFHSEYFFAGLSIPRLLNSDIDMIDRPVPLSRESRHGFAMAGGKIPLSDRWDLVPQLLIRQVPGAPISIDLNLGVMYLKRITLAGTWRNGGLNSEWGSSIDVILGAQIARSLFLGASYDILLSSLRNQSSGSAELILRYTFDGSVQAQDAPVRVINPRYF